jgi:hypothetical protein
VREGGRGRERGPGGEGSKGRSPQRAIFILNLFLLSLPVSAQPFTTTLPGTLVDAAGVNGPGGRPGVALLVAAGRDGKGAKTLLFLDPASRGTTRWAGGLHEEINAVRAFDVAGDGVATPVAGMPGLLFTPAGGGTARRFFEQQHLDLRSVTGATAGRPWIATARAGLLELLGHGPGGGLARLASFPLPLEAQRPRWGLRIASPPVTLLPGDPPLFAVGPKEEGRRLQTLLIPAGGEPAVESWSLLPAGERLMDDRRYLRFDGVPALAVASFEKVGLLAKKRFRLFLVQLDRSRRGGGPVLTVDTDCPLWLPLDAMSGDADGDGRKDLVLAHPGGLRGKEMLLSVHRGLGAGRFDPKPRRWKVNAEPTDWLYGPDPSGDGVPDFLLLTGDRLLVYPGDPKGSRPLAGKPSRSIPIPGAPKRDDDEDPEVGDEGPTRERFLQAVEMPGGGTAILVRGATKDGKTALTVLSLSSPKPPA